MPAVSSDADVICLLDDEPCVLKAIGRLLASAGLKVEKFTEPKQFLVYALAHPVRLAVIDICMPGMSGLEVQDQLRMSVPTVRVIVMTGEDNPNHRAAALAGGAVAFFLKPFDDESFLKAVRAALAP